MSAPQTMAARRDRIRTLIAEGQVPSQAHLRELLSREGIVVTQATLSRDLDAIGAVKRVSSDGDIRYALQEPASVSRLEPVNSADAVARIVAEVLVNADSAQNLAVLRTPPGAAMYLAGTLDRSGMPDLLGTVAGDDTVMVVMRSAQAAADLCALLLTLAEGRPQRSVANGATGSTRRRTS